MRCLKWIKVLAITGLFFLVAPQTTSADTFSVLQASQYSTSVSNFPLQSFAMVDSYLGGSFKVDAFTHFFTHTLKDGFEDAADAIAAAAKKAADAVASAVTTAVNAVKNAVTVAADATGDALKKAGEVTGHFIKDHAVLIGMIAGAVLLTVVTDGMAGPLVGELIADDVAVAATEAGIEAGVDAGSEAGEAGAEAGTEAGEASAEGGADSSTTIDEDVEAATDTEETSVEKAANFASTVYGWYEREVLTQDIIEAIKGKNFKQALEDSIDLETDLSGSTSKSNADTIQELQPLIADLKAGNLSRSEDEDADDGDDSDDSSNSDDTGTDNAVAQLLAQAQAVQQQAAQQVKTLTTQLSTQLPAGSNTSNVIAAFSLIKSSGLSTAQQATVQQWATQHNTPQDVIFLTAALQYATLYNAAQGGTAAQQTAYQHYADSLPASALGSVMGFAADGKLISDSTTLSNQALSLTDPYQYYLTEQIQAEQTNLNAQQNQTNLNNNVTATNSSNYAISQMISLLSTLTPAQRQNVMNTFYGNATTLGDTATTTLMQQYISPTGTVLNSDITTTETETVQTVITNAQNAVSNASSLLTAAQNLQNGYNYSSYYNNTSSNLGGLLQVAASLPASSTLETTESVQAQIASSGLSTQAQTNLTTYLTQNGSQTGAANAVSATIQYAQLFNAAYGTSTPAASAQQAFASYSNKLDPNTSTAMMKFAVQQGLVSQQNSLLITDPAQWLQNQINFANQNNQTLGGLLNNESFDQAMYNRQMTVYAQDYDPMTLSFANDNKSNVAADQAQLANLKLQYIVNPTQYAMYQLYNATKNWSQAQLQTLSSRVYYGSILNGSGMSSTIQNYLTPSGVYQNSPQNIMTAQAQAAASVSATNPQMTPAALAQALTQMSPNAAQAWLNSYQSEQQMNQINYNMQIQEAQQGGGGIVTPPPAGLYDKVAAQYQANTQTQNTPSTPQEKIAAQQQTIMMQQLQQAMGGNGLGGPQAMGGTLSY